MASPSQPPDLTSVPDPVPAELIGDAAPPREALLVTLLGPNWLWLDRPPADTVVLLHRDGAWTELHAPSVYELPEVAARAIAAALLPIRLRPGRFTLEMNRFGGGYEVRAVWPEPPRLQAALRKQAKRLIRNAQRAHAAGGGGR